MSKDLKRGEAQDIWLTGKWGFRPRECSVGAPWDKCVTASGWTGVEGRGGDRPCRSLYKDSIFYFGHAIYVYLQFFFWKLNNCSLSKYSLSPSRLV